LSGTNRPFEKLNRNPRQATDDFYNKIAPQLTNATGVEPAKYSRHYRGDWRWIWLVESTVVVR
jgi:hypothetical protein